MKFSSVAITGAALGLAHAGPVTKRAISDGMLLDNLLEKSYLPFMAI